MDRLTLNFEDIDRIDLLQLESCQLLDLLRAQEPQFLSSSWSIRIKVGPLRERGDSGPMSRLRSFIVPTRIMNRDTYSGDQQCVTGILQGLTLTDYPTVRLCGESI